jgi:hypothetical protein
MAGFRANSLRLVWRGVQGDEAIHGARWRWRPPGPGDPAKWSVKGRLGGGAFNSTQGPVLATARVDSGRLMVWKGSGTDARIWTTTDDAFWDRSRAVVVSGPDGPFVTTGRPAMAVLADDSRLLAWRAPDNALLWAIKGPGRPWSEPQRIGATTSHGPALAAYGQEGYEAYMAWKPADDERIWVSWFIGDGWTAPEPAPMAQGAARTTDVPALARTSRGLAMAWRGAADPYIWWSQAAFGGARWSAPRRAEPSSGGISTSHGPALAMTSADTGGVLHLVWKGNGADQRVWWSQRQGDRPWSTPTVIDPGINTFASPALASHHIQAIDDGVDAVPVPD